MRLVVGALGLCVLLRGPCPALSCALCSGNPLQGETLSQSAGRARLVVYGTLANPRLTGNDATGGITDLRIEGVMKSDPFLVGRKVIELPRYVPADPRDPPRFLVFCDIYKDKNNKQALDPYKGIPIRSEAAVAYIQGLMRLDPKDKTASLLYFFGYLDHPDEIVSSDAFAEFARANDQEVGAVAPRLSAAKLRTWLSDSQTPAARLGLYAFLLGNCGSAQDAALLRSLIDRPSERTAAAADGILSGYIQLRPRQGWDVVAGMLADSRRPFADRFAALRVLRFYHSWKPRETQPQVLRALAPTLSQADLADMSVEDLRRWKLWNLTSEVVAQYGKKSHEAPIVRRAIVRYCLSCPQAEAARFVAGLRRGDSELVRDVEETLQFEK